MIDNYIFDMEILTFSIENQVFEVNSIIQMFSCQCVNYTINGLTQQGCDADLLDSNRSRSK